MALNTFLTPKNNEFKSDLLMTRYMSEKEVLPDELRMLMDVDIIRDLALRTMHINPDMPYDLASLTARQVYLGEPITGIELPIITDDEEEIVFEEDKKEDIIEEPKEEIIEEPKEEINDLINDVPEMGDLIEDSSSMDELIDDSSDKVNDDSLKEELDLPGINDELKAIEETSTGELINDIDSNFEVEKMDLFSDLPEENKEELDLFNNDISDNALDALQDTLDVQNQPTMEDIEEKLGNTLTNGLSMDFLDEPVLQKVKTR